MNAKPVEYHEGASADVRSAVAWYQSRSPKAALDFIEELHRAANTIREAPDRWPPGKNNTRRFLLWRFPFSIIYSEQESIITIWAVAHLKDRIRVSVRGGRGQYLPVRVKNWNDDFAGHYRLCVRNSRYEEQR